MAERSGVKQTLHEHDLQTTGVSSEYKVYRRQKARLAAGLWSTAAVMPLGVFALRSAVALDHARGDPDRPDVAGFVMPDSIPDAKVLDGLFDVKD